MSGGGADRVRLREARDGDGDVDAMLAVSKASDLAQRGEPDTTADDIRGLLATSTVRVVVAEADDAADPVGWAWVEYVAGHSRVSGVATARPGADAVGRALFDWVRRTARELGPGLPLRTFADSEDAGRRHLYESAGGELIRRFLRMVADLDEVAAPRLPTGVTVVDVASGGVDLRTVYDIDETAFADHFGHEPGTFDAWLEEIGTSLPDRSLWWLASVEGVPAAVLLATSLSDETGYVDALGTLREFRGRGLGRALLLTAFAELKRRGRRRVVLGVDSESPTGAVGLYESVGMRAGHTGLQYLVPPLP